ncbi:PaaI family thioesterase [Spirosoma sp. KCTC 42546]|uniref:PaaI family thioesterase n=1 Tax=Spirosoma sp. KCTC 42546 TaxID=2520506 RepID=UPI00115B700D|nr:PaaI family thioesterase [Spirosoma sp. KCTC 42546]QDK82511.1 PaaI family thioesterase [Spirosoma sp. KCTC 42546]
MTTEQTETQRIRTYSWEDQTIGAKVGATLSGMDYLQGMMAGLYPAPAIANTLDMGIESVEEGKVVFSIVPQEFHYNPIGAVHGGVFCTLLDSALACAIHSTLPIGTGYTTLELKVNFIRPLTLKTGKVLAIGTLVHAGRSVATAEGKIVDEQGKLYAHATTTCMLFPWR